MITSSHAWGIYITFRYNHQTIEQYVFHRQIYPLSDRGTLSTMATDTAGMRRPTDQKLGSQCCMTTLLRSPVQASLAKMAPTARKKANKHPVAPVPLKTTTPPGYWVQGGKLCCPEVLPDYQCHCFHGSLRFTGHCWDLPFPRKPRRVNTFLYIVPNRMSYHEQELRSWCVANAGFPSNIPKPTSTTWLGY